MLAIKGLLSLALLAATFLLLARVAVDWVAVLAAPGPNLSKFSAGIRRATDPVLVPLRRVLPPLRLGSVQLDLSIPALIALIFVLRVALGV
jgi:YggT family protein